MRAKNLLIALPALIGMGFAPLSNVTESPAQTLAAGDEAEFSSAQISTLQSFFEGAWEADSRVELSYLDGLGYITVKDQVSDTARYTESYLYSYDGQYTYDLSQYYISNIEGGSYLQTLDITNSVESNAITAYDSYSGSYVTADFDTYYGSPFTWLVELDDTDFESHFTVTEVEDGYDVAPDAYATSYLAEPFTYFFPMHDGYTWDAKTASYGLDELVIHTDSDGTPVSMTFTVYTKDRFGSAAETYTSTLKSITAVDTVPTYETKSDADATKLASALSDLADDIAKGNFTQSIDIGAEVSDGVYQSGLAYNNYFDLGEESVSGFNAGLMLSDNPLEDSSYGETYVGAYETVYQGNEGEYVTAYQLVGVSPDADYTGLVTSDYYTLEEILPQIGTMSTDFFDYENGVYTFDLTDSRVATSSFAVAVLDALFGYGDGMSALIPTYCDDLVSYTYDFSSLQIALDEDGDFESATLYYNSAYMYYYYGYENAYTTITFSDFGTTDLTEVEALHDALVTLGAISE